MGKIGTSLPGLLNMVYTVQVFALTDIQCFVGTEIKFQVYVSLKPMPVPSMMMRITFLSQCFCPNMTPVSHGGIIQKWVSAVPGKGGYKHVPKLEQLEV